MNEMAFQLLAAGAFELVAIPVIVSIIKRFIGKRMDEMDEKRDEARKERKEQHEEDRAWREGMTAGMRSLLRAEIIGEHRRAMERGGVSLESKEYLTRVHAAYKGVGGNDMGDALYEEVMSLPTRSRERNTNAEQGVA